MDFNCKMEELGMIVNYCQLFIEEIFMFFIFYDILSEGVIYFDQNQGIFTYMSYMNYSSI